MNDAPSDTLKIDLHVHSRERSGCARGAEEEMIAAAKAQGLDGIAFTDHDRLVPPGRLVEMNRDHAPFRVFSGIEVSLTLYDHCLVLGLAAAELEGGGWTYEKLHRFCRERGGFVCLAHPLRFSESVPFDVEAFPPDAFEARSVHTKAGAAAEISLLAARVGAGLLCNSDAHYPSQVGIFHNEVGNGIQVAGDGVPTDGVRADGVPTDGVRADGVQADGVRTDDVRSLDEELVRLLSTGRRACRESPAGASGAPGMGRGPVAIRSAEF